jgi:predicted phage terminase large subunit-like protein
VNEAGRRLTIRVAKTVLAEKSLHDFVKMAWHVVEPEIQFKDSWHIKALCEHLQATVEGRITQLLVNVPPGTSKSLICCVFFPAWVWATQPAKRFLYFSYSETLSLRDSIRTRDLLRSEWYQKQWKVELKADRDTMGRFENIRGGWRLVGSISGRGIGEHGDYVLCDDPHNVLQAESDADRQTVTRWFEGVFCVRGEVRDAKRILIMQRLHALDCSGVALDKGGWTHLCLPMKYEIDHPHATIKDRPTTLGFYDPRTQDGELLWPDVYTPTKVANMENNLGVYVSAGQLQQRPAPRGGGMFKREWFGILKACPNLRQIVRYFDKAGTAGGTGAQTSGCLIATFDNPSALLDSMRTQYIILDFVCGRWEAAQREAVILQTAEADRMKWGHVTTWTEQEPGSGGKESAQSTVGNLAGFDCQFERVTGPKEVRAEPLAAQASVGKVWLLAGDWNSTFLEQITQFPMGKLRDMCDSASGAFNKLASPGTGLARASDLRFAKRESAFESSRLRAEDFG